MPSFKLLIGDHTRSVPPVTEQQTQTVTVVIRPASTQTFVAGQTITVAEGDEAKFYRMDKNKFKEL